MLCNFMSRDDDMQSVASLMSMDRSYDIGNLDEIDDDEQGFSMCDESASASISELASKFDVFNIEEETADGKVLSCLTFFSASFLSAIQKVFSTTVVFTVRSGAHLMSFLVEVLYKYMITTIYY